MLVIEMPLDPRIISTMLILQESVDKVINLRGLVFREGSFHLHKYSIILYVSTQSIIILKLQKNQILKVHDIFTYFKKERSLSLTEVSVF